jgi:hypothetical protein
MHWTNCDHLSGFNTEDCSGIEHSVFGMKTWGRGEEFCMKNEVSFSSITF